jgi:hypothetical protein
VVAPASHRELEECVVPEAPEVSRDLGFNRPHTARIYDYLLGGKDNFQVDRDAGDKIRQNAPDVPVSMRANRRFMARVAEYLARAGIRQFLDIGTGLPTSPNLHEVVQAIAPECRIVYVDNDPLVLAHARALLNSDPRGTTEYIDADLRDPDAIIGAPALHAALDLSQPVAVTMIAILQFVTEPGRDREIIDTFLRLLPPGSALALSTVTIDSTPQQGPASIQSYQEAGITVKTRDRAEVEALFDGLELVDPGVTLVHRWRPGEEDRALRDDQVFMYGGAAFKR